MQESQVWYAVEASASIRNTYSFAMCPVRDNECVAVSDAMMKPSVDGGNLGTAGLINSLTLVDLIREQALTTSIYMSDPDCLMGRYKSFTQFVVPKWMSLIGQPSSSKRRPTG